jgi:hypothetical protein
MTSLSVISECLAHDISLLTGNRHDRNLGVPEKPSDWRTAVTPARDSATIVVSTNVAADIPQDSASAIAPAKTLNPGSPKMILRKNAKGVQNHFGRPFFVVPEFRLIGVGSRKQRCYWAKAERRKVSMR